MGSSSYPDGYRGIDRPSHMALMECPAGHVWATDVHYECGMTAVDRDTCPHDGMDGKWSDADGPCDVATKAPCVECGEWTDFDDLDHGVCVGCRAASAMREIARVDGTALSDMRVVSAMAGLGVRVG